MTDVYALIAILGIAGVAVVFLGLLVAVVIDWWQLRKCAKRGHDFSRGPCCRRCEAPQPVMSGKGGF